MAKKLTLKEIDDQIKALNAQRAEALEESITEQRSAIESLLIKAKDHYHAILSAGVVKVWTGEALSAAKAIGLAPREVTGGAESQGKSVRLRGDKKDAFVPVLLAAITKKMSRGDIEALPAVVEHLKAAGFDKVPNLTPILAEQVKAHKLATEGKKASMKYGPA